MRKIIRKITGSSPLLATWGVIDNLVGGDQDQIPQQVKTILESASTTCPGPKTHLEEVFADILRVDSDGHGLFTSDHSVPHSEYNKPARLTMREVNKLMATKSKHLTPNERLIRSVIEEALTSRKLDSLSFENLNDMIEFRQKYKNYLRVKGVIPYLIVGPYTNMELQKMAIAKALGSTSVMITFPISYF